MQDVCCDLDEVLLDHNYADSTVFDSVVYFLDGYLIKMLNELYNCNI